jgi:hypothetical protein
VESKPIVMELLLFRIILLYGRTNLPVQYSLGKTFMVKL